MYVFVYGTLKTGHSNHGILSGSKFVSKATVRGYELYNTGFPVAAQNPETNITGEVFDIGDVMTPEAQKIVSRLDSLEGYHKENPHHSMYHRVPVIAYGDDQETYDVQMYRGNPEYWNGFKGMRKCDYDRDENSWTWSR